MNNEEYEQAILDDVLNCNSCVDIGNMPRHNLKGLDKIEYMKKNLPALDYVKNQTVYYIFSNGITTGETESNNVLQRWLYQKNLNGVPNYLVLQSAVGNACVDGCCGIRVYEDSLYEIRRGYYATLTQRL